MKKANAKFQKFKARQEDLASERREKRIARLDQKIAISKRETALEQQRATRERLRPRPTMGFGGYSEPRTRTVTRVVERKPKRRKKRIVKRVTRRQQPRRSDAMGDLVGF